LHVVGRLDQQEAAVLAPFLKSLDEKGARHLMGSAREIGEMSPGGSTDASSLPWHPTDTSYTSVTGLVLRPGGNPIDMMPSFLKQRVRRRISWQTGLRCFVVCYCMTWSVFLTCWRTVVRNTQATIAYDDAWQKAQPDVRAFQAWAGLRAFQRGAWGAAGMSGVLDEVFGNIPEGVVLTEMRAERGVCSFSGLSPDGRAVLGLRKALASSPLFSDVFLDFIGQDAQKNTQRFSMRCRVKEQ